MPAKLRQGGPRRKTTGIFEQVFDLVSDAAPSGIGPLIGRLAKRAVHVVLLTESNPCFPVGSSQQIVKPV